MVSFEVIKKKPGTYFYVQATSINMLDSPFDNLTIAIQ